MNIRNFTLIKVLTLSIAIFGLMAIGSFFAIVFNSAFFHFGQGIDTGLGEKFGSLFGGFVGTLFSMLSVFLLIYTINIQAADNRKTKLTDYFFKMLDYHNANVSDLSVAHIDTEKDYQSNGRRAFVIYKIQLKRLLETVKEINLNKNLNLEDKEVIDVAYIVFYYGLDRKWISFIDEKLNRYGNKKEPLIAELLTKIESNPNLKIGRTNQTGLSSYFRNMYNAIKLVDDDNDLSTKEKEKLIKIYRAQLSNPELYIIFYNVASRFGYNWQKNDFIRKYEFLKNIPRGYAEAFEPEQFFHIGYDDYEIDNGVTIETN